MSNLILFLFFAELSVIPAEKRTSLKHFRVLRRVMQKPLEAGIKGNSGKFSCKSEIDKEKNQVLSKENIM